MLSWGRRDFMIAAGAAGACGMAPTIGADRATMASLPQPRIIVGDTRFAQSRAFARATAKSGGRIAWISGDVTDLWYGQLDLLWRREKVSLTGLTTYAPFFYLQQLAMDRGLRVTFRAEFGQAGTPTTPHGLSAWVIAPKPLRHDIA